ncbi:MAG: hypothetical protein AB8G22_07820 [Saprospiraceae bacterium]
MKATIYNIVKAFNLLNLDEKIAVLQLLVQKISIPIRSADESSISYDLMSIAGTGKGIYGDVEQYIASERDWN